jgi:hypothetical protein
MGLESVFLSVRPIVLSLARSTMPSSTTLFSKLASQDVVEIERSAGYAERLITRSIDRAGRE